MKTDTTKHIKEMILKSSSIELELVWIPRIMARQEYSEIKAGKTTMNNGYGLSGVDGAFVTDVYKQLLYGKHLSEGQADAIRRVLQKYARQYAEMMNAPQDKQKKLF